MTQSLNGQSYALAAAKLLKEQEYAIQKIEKRTSNLHKIRHSLDNCIVDFKAKKTIHADYDRTYHQSLDEHEIEIQKQEMKFTLFLQRITEISQKTFDFLRYKSLTEDEFQKLEAIGYNRNALVLSEKSVSICSKFLQAQNSLLQGRVCLFQTTLQSVSQILKKARKQDVFSRPFGLYNIVFGSTKDPLEDSLNQKKQLRAPSPDFWMEKSSKEVATNGFFEDRSCLTELEIVQALEILLVQKKINNTDLYLDSFSAKELQKTQSDELMDVSLHFDQGSSEESVKEDQCLVEEMSNSPFIEEKAWAFLDKAFEEPYVQNDCLKVKFRSLKKVHDSFTDNIEEVKRRGSGILEDLKNRSLKLSVGDCEDSAFYLSENLSEFKAKKIVGFDVYLQMKSLVEDLKLAQSEYQEVIEKISMKLVDKECVDHLKKLRFSISFLKNTQDWLSLFQRKQRYISEQIILIDNLMLSLQKTLDTACLAEHIAEKKVYSFERSLHMFRREYVYFNLGLKEYQAAIS